MRKPTPNPNKHGETTQLQIYVDRVTQQDATLAGRRSMVDYKDEGRTSRYMNDSESSLGEKGNVSRTFIEF